MFNIVKKVSGLAAIGATLATALTLLSPIANAQQIPRELTKILAIGDSITEGFSVDGGIESYRFPLTSELNNTSCNYRMVGRRTSNVPATSFFSPHEGYSGHGVEHFLMQLAGNPGIESIITDADPDVVLIHLGSNDMNRNQDEEQTIGELNLLVSSIWNIKSDTQVYVANVIPWFGSSNLNPNIRQSINSLGSKINTWITDSNDSRLHLVDVRSGFIRAYMQSDDIHPNSDGDNHIADAFLAAIEANNDCPTPPETILVSPAIPDPNNPGDTFDTLPAAHTFTGSAFDMEGDGIQRVRIAIEDNNHTNSSNQWFNFATGEFGSYSETIATLSNRTATSATWSIDVVLPGGGDYQFYALAVDNLGNQNYFNRGVWPENTRFFTDVDVSAPQPTFTTPETDGAILTSGSINLSGTATDTGGSGLQDIRISLRNISSGRWFNFSNNSFTGAIGNGAISANQTNTSPASASWNYTFSLTPGDYSVHINARDNAGNTSGFQQRKFTVLPDDTQPPQALISTPAANGDSLSTSTIFTGSATDAGGSGFNDIRFAIRNLTNNRWYNFNNNSFNGAVGNGSIAANLTNTSIGNTNWNVSLTLPPGNYSAHINARDNAGNISGFRNRTFTILPDDNQSPDGFFTNPAVNNETLTSNITFTGTATDSGGSGVNDVLFAVRDVNSGNWYNFNNNSFNGAVGNGSTTANLSNTTTNSTNWNYSLTLPPGEYSVHINVRDNAGLISGFQNRRFTVIPNDTQSPNGNITTPAVNNDTLASNIIFRGTATDGGGSGFKDVLVSIRDRSTGNWYNFNNNSFSGATGNGATTANLTFTSTNNTNWNFPVALPSGNYSVHVNIRDNAGNTSGFQNRRFSVP